jgi:capsular polysaccharide transport system permease protein
MSEYDTVRRAVETAGVRTGKERAVIYQRLRTQRRASLRKLPTRVAAGAKNTVRTLNDAIRSYELDLVAGKVRDWSEALPAAQIDPSIDTVTAPASSAPPLSRIRTLAPLTMRTLLLLRRAGPAASVWIVIEPLMQIGIILAIYLALGYTDIVDMDPLPFAVVGTSAWFMFRMTYIRCAVGPVDESLLLIPRIRAVDVLACRALSYGVIYTLAGIAVLTVLGLFGLGAPVERPMDVFFTWCVILVMAFSLGIILRTLCAYVPVLQRGVPWTARLLIYSSGVLFVTEQLPDFLAKPMLLNPLLNALQHLRSAYFTTYESHDVSLAYATVSSIAMLTLGLILYAANRRKV